MGFQWEQNVTGLVSREGMNKPTNLQPIRLQQDEEGASGSKSQGESAKKRIRA